MSCLFVGELIWTPLREGHDVVHDERHRVHVVQAVVDLATTDGAGRLEAADDCTVTVSRRGVALGPITHAPSPPALYARLMEASGHNGQMHFDGAFVRITRSGTLARMSHGQGEKVVPLASVGTVQLKPAGMLSNGFIQLGVLGGREVASQKGKRTVAAAADENSVIFTRKQQPAFEALRDAILAGIASR